MVSAAHLYIGQSASSDEEVCDIFAKLGIKITERTHEFLEQVQVHKDLILAGETIRVGVTFDWESESNTKIVGFSLTSRYEPSILDRGHERGRPDLFAIDVEACADLLRQTREFWPEAQLLIWDREY